MRHQRIFTLTSVLTADLCVPDLPIVIKINSKAGNGRKVEEMQGRAKPTRMHNLTHAHHSTYHLIPPFAARARRHKGAECMGPEKAGEVKEQMCFFKEAVRTGDAFSPGMVLLVRPAKK